jgi:hypothetical protein
LHIYSGSHTHAIIIQYRRKVTDDSIIACQLNIDAPISRVLAGSCATTCNCLSTYASVIYFFGISAASGDIVIIVIREKLIGLALLAFA